MYHTYNSTQDLFFVRTTNFFCHAHKKRILVNPTVVIIIIIIMQEHQENPQDGTPPEFMRMDASLNKMGFHPEWTGMSKMRGIAVESLKHTDTQNCTSS